MTLAISKYLNTRLGAIEKMIGTDSDLARCDIEISRAAGNKHQSDHMFYTEMHIVIPGLKSVYAKNHASTVNASIDDVKEEIERQLRKQKKTMRSDEKKKGREAKRKLQAGR